MRCYSAAEGRFGSAAACCAFSPPKLASAQTLAKKSKTDHAGRDGLETASDPRPLIRALVLSVFICGFRGSGFVQSPRPTWKRLTDNNRRSRSNETRGSSA